MTRRIFVDTDTASDDAVALVMAFEHFADSLVGIGVVAGNTPLEQPIQNALFVRELCHSQTPVYAGAARPLVRPLETAQNVHGQDGMGDIGLLIGDRVSNEGHAVHALIDAPVAEACNTRRAVLSCTSVVRGFTLEIVTASAALSSLFHTMRR